MTWQTTVYLFIALLVWLELVRTGAPRGTAVLLALIWPLLLLWAAFNFIFWRDPYYRS